LNGGSIASSDVALTDGGSLSGSGSIRSLTTSGSYSQVYPTGIINTGNVSFGSNTSFGTNLAGPTAGVDYGQLNVTGCWETSHISEST